MKVLTMTREEQEYLYNLVQNPPSGSKIEAAKQYGVDLTLNLRRLALTPTERSQDLERAMELVYELRRAWRKSIGNQLGD